MNRTWVVLKTVSGNIWTSSYIQMNLPSMGGFVTKVSMDRIHETGNQSGFVGDQDNKSSKVSMLTVDISLLRYS